MGLSWPLQVGCRELIPVELDLAWSDTVHLVERATPGAGATPGYPAGADSQMTGWALEGGLGPVWRTRTLCGRAAGAVVRDPTFDLLGEHRHLLCRSCWRTVEGWLSPPSPAPGEDAVVAWTMTTVLEIGEAMVEGVPVPRLEVVPFDIAESDLAGLRSLDIDSLAEPEAFMSKYSRLWGGTPNHGYEYLTRGTQFGTEHFFDRSIIGLLGF